MDFMWLLALLALVQDPIQTPQLFALLSRAAEEAEILRQNAPKALTQETLEQRTLMPPSRFRPRIEKPATEVPKPRLVVREIVSEYSVGTLKDSASNDLIEFRQVTSVDGRKVQSEEKARHFLSIGIKSPDDRVRKRMLEEFRLLDASAYSSVPKSTLYVVSTSPDAGFPVQGVSEDVARFACNWETDLNDLMMPKPVLEYLSACLTVS